MQCEWPLQRRLSAGALAAGSGLADGCELPEPPACSVMRRNASDTFRHKLGAGELADIAKADHADHAPALVDDREPPDVQLFHVMHRLGEIVVLAAAMDAGRHHVPRLA